MQGAGKRARARKKPLQSDDVQVPADRVQQLEIELKRLSGRKHPLEFSIIVSCLLFAIGAVALIASIIYASTISGLIGLGLSFWGALLLYVRPQNYVRTSLSNSAITNLLMTINQIIANTETQEKAIYIPPQDVTELKGGKVFIPIPNEENPSLATKSSLQTKNSPFGMYVSPTGLGLANLFEAELGIDFNKVDLEYLAAKFPKLFIEDFEIAEKFQMTTENNIVTIRITGSTYQSVCNEMKGLPNICNSIGCPFCSSIAVALNRATGKPLVIENCQSKELGTVETNYRIIGE